MNFLLFIFVGVLSACQVSSFIIHPFFSGKASFHKIFVTSGSVQSSEFTTNNEIPLEISQHHSLNDMILVERLEQPEKSVSGIYFSKSSEGGDAKLLGRVLSIPVSGVVSAATGHVVPINQLAPYQQGDIVAIKDHWGIGPKSFELGDRCFSFHKAEHIIGKIQQPREN